MQYFFHINVFPCNILSWCLHAFFNNTPLFVRIFHTRGEGLRVKMLFAIKIIQFRLKIVFIYAGQPLIIIYSVISLSSVPEDRPC